MDSIVSIIIGMIFGYVFFNLFINTTINKGPDSKDIINKIYEYNNKKYRLKPIICVCPISMSMNNLST